MARFFLLGLFLLAAAVARADSLASAQLARTLLGPGVWSRVLRIENGRPDPCHPRQFHGLVFAIEDRLWLYCDTEGTQSLSLYAGRLERDKADLNPLLRAILPGLAHFEEAAGAGPGLPQLHAATGADLPYGCFIECVARWRELQAGPFPPEEGGLLAYYVDPGGRLRGHTVLVYQQGGRRYFHDPSDRQSERRLPSGVDFTPLQVARAISPTGTPFKAQLLALHRGDAPRGPTVAANDGASTADSARGGQADSSGPAGRAALF